MARFMQLAKFMILAAAAVIDGPSAFGQHRPQGEPDLLQLQKKFNSIKWQNGPTTGKIGSLADVKVPQGFKFTDRQGLLTFLELTQNPATDRDLGMICPANYNLFNNADASWFLTFEWDGIGRVSDEDKNNLDGNAIMQSMKDGQERDNQNRRTRGWPTLTILGWSKAPFYDPETNLLTWATRIDESAAPGKITVNYNSRILGREGVMSANLVVGEGELEQALGNYKQIVKGFSYVPGKKYSEWRSGDKVAGYGLTALMAGGAVAAAAQGGFLGKLGKGIIYIGAAIVAGIGALFRKIFGGGKQDATS